MSFLAITTRYISPSNTRGARISATTLSGERVTIIRAWDSRVGVDANHAAVARDLAKKLEWHGAWYGGDTRTGMAFVRMPIGTAAPDSSFCC